MVKKEVSSTIDAIIDKLDPVQAAIMVLGGTAAACGIVPPMTQLLRVISGSNPAGSLGDILFTPGYQQVSNATGIDIWKLLTTPGYQFDWSNLGGQFGMGSGSAISPTKALTDEERKLRNQSIGLFCSGAVEAAIMYEFVRNPTTFTQLIKLPGEIAGGLGKLIP